MQNPLNTRLIFQVCGIWESGAGSTQLALRLMSIISFLDFCCSDQEGGPREAMPAKITMFAKMGKIKTGLGNA